MEAHSRILVVTEVNADAEMVCGLLADAYPGVARSTDPRRFVESFDEHRPQVIVLAFKTMNAAEQFYAELNQRSKLVNDFPHRTLVLCRKEDLKRAYALCCKDYFDDYVLFWPLAHDAMRLPMSVRLALKALSATQNEAMLSQLAAQARRIGDLEEQLDRQLALGHAHADHAQATMHVVRSRVGEVLGAASATPEAVGADAASLHAVDDPDVHRSLDGAISAIKPIKRWIGALKDELQETLEAAQSMARQLENLPRVVLVVDDDLFMRKLLAQVLTAARYEVALASTVVEMMSFLRTRRADLIIMDVGMPGVDGIEGTRKLKSFAAFADIPVIMLTGESRKDRVIESMRAGAIDYIVKPFDRDMLLKKVDKRLGA